jgi:hypothetical protein
MNVFKEKPKRQVIWDKWNNIFLFHILLYSYYNANISHYEKKRSRAAPTYSIPYAWLFHVRQCGTYTHVAIIKKSYKKRTQVAFAPSARQPFEFLDRAALIWDGRRTNKK